MKELAWPMKKHHSKTNLNFSRQQWGSICLTPVLRIEKIIVLVPVPVLRKQNLVPSRTGTF